MMLAALCCMVMVQAQVVHHDQSEPTDTTVGYVQECWENTETGKLYARPDGTQELNPAVVIRYAKLAYNPVSTDGATVKESATYEDVPFNWAAETDLRHNKSIEFTVVGEDVHNARLKWYKNYGDVSNGHFTVTVYVNGNSVYSVNQGLFWETDEAIGWNYEKPLEGVFAVPLPDLKTGDVVKFEFHNGPYESSYSPVIFAASLEYTSATRGARPITVTAQDKKKIVGGPQDPQWTWSVTQGSLAPNDNLSDICFTRDEGEEVGEYTIHVSQPEGANPKYHITFVDGTFSIVDGEFHKECEAAYDSVGYIQDVWIEEATGKLYSDAIFTEELNPAEVIVYKKLIESPITGVSQEVLIRESEEQGGSQFNWAARFKYHPEDVDKRYADFTVFGTNVDNARIKWFKDLGGATYGKFIFAVYVNGDCVYSANQLDGKFLGGIKEIPLPGLKTGDVVRFEVDRHEEAYAYEYVYMLASLEYTSSNGGKEATVTVTAKQDNRNKGSYYATFYSSTCAYKVPDGVTAYTGVVDGGCLRMTAVEGNIIPQGEPVVLKATVAPQAAGMLKGSYDEMAGDTIQLTMKPAASTALPSEDNDLVGTENGFATAPANSWMLSVNAYYAGFFPLNPGFIPSEGSSIAPNSAYLQFDYPVDVISFELKFDQDIPTGVDDLKRDCQSDGKKYDILGRPVGDDYKGIVIMNGKKSLTPNPLQ